jgi:aspartyl-tRNA(Asn)/glutamyl-tRNA(Gln) amidotransferase subunit B
MNYEAVIGLEVHAQLLTNSKIFCGCPAKFGQQPNSATCPVCLGLPGALPVLNRRAVEFALRVILAVGGNVNSPSVFARKNYFYPDLPKGYQISQYDKPVGIGGAIHLIDNGVSNSVALTRIHLEEDAGKSLHPDSSGQDYTRIDVNRCGTPLIEIVSEPQLRTPHEAFLYLHSLKQIVEYLGVCDGNMEEGSLRCDANVSIRLIGETELGTKTEVKNMNSIRGVEKALTYEISRQINVVSSGGKIEQQTLLYNDSDGKCHPMRSKEGSHDYRYFPDPDLVSIAISDEWISKVRESLPELPQRRRERFVNEYGLPVYDAEILTESRPLADYFEATAKHCGDAKLASNWIMTEVLARLKEPNSEVGRFAITPGRLGGLIAKVKSKAITGKIAKELFEIMLSDEREPDTIISEKGLAPVADSGDLEKLIDQIVVDHPDEVARYREGKTKLFAFFVGQLMKVTQGKADPQRAGELLRERLNR